ncbi:MAG: HAD-IIIA family hydrolase [Candidatus Daviesbacteria bacterium]|nr:HAD-IIIA family hydrolase [Candidatus Daviesbacteria bacterium]
MPNLSEISVAILAGGLGTRLSSILPGQQKVIAKVNTQPFLEYLLNQLSNAGFKNVVLCTRYLSDQVKEKLGKKNNNIDLVYSKEDAKLGTGGALRLALPLLKSQNILVMNGDTYCDIDLKKFVKFHFEKKANVSLVSVYVSDTSRFGSVNLDSNDAMEGFEEKRLGSGSGWINGGVYMIKRSFLSKIPQDGEISLEKEIFPKWIGKSFYAYKSQDDFIDIGTPESYFQAGQFFEKSKKKNQKRFVLLDRDGTLIVERKYLSDPDGVEFIPGALQALKRLKEMGLGIVLITNQAGIGRGYFDLTTLERIHKKLTGLLLKEGITLDDIYFCPHTPEDNCLCRKPKPGMVEEAIKKHNFDPKLCFVIGDNKGDIELGRNIGATTILVRTGYGKQIENDGISPDYVVDNLEAAPPIIYNELL